jgi:hypothetical protein
LIAAWFVRMSRDLDRVSNGDAVLIDQDLLDQQPENLLALVNVESFGRFAQAQQKACQGLG